MLNFGDAKMTVKIFTIHYTINCIVKVVRILKPEIAEIVTEQHFHVVLFITLYKAVCILFIFAYTLAKRLVCTYDENTSDSSDIPRSDGIPPESIA